MFLAVQNARNFPLRRVLSEAENEHLLDEWPQLAHGTPESRVGLLLYRLVAGSLTGLAVIDDRDEIFSMQMANRWPPAGTMDLGPVFAG